MREDPLSHRYIKVGDKIGLMVREDMRPGQMIERRVMVQTIIQDKIIKEIDLEEISEGIIDRIVEKNTEMKGMATTIEMGIDQEGNYRRDRSSSNDRSRTWSRASTNRDRIRCYACREYDHFARDCPNSREERDLEQLQHMLNMEEQDHRSPSMYSSDEDCRSPLNL